jgi:ferredoxin
MKVHVDEDKCAGHGVCVGLCPEVFDLADRGYAIALVEEVPAEHEQAAREAANQCPTWAITLTD